MLNPSLSRIGTLCFFCTFSSAVFGSAAAPLVWLLSGRQERFVFDHSSFLQMFCDTSDTPWSSQDTSIVQSIAIAVACVQSLATRCIWSLLSRLPYHYCHPSRIVPLLVIKPDLQFNPELFSGTRFETGDFWQLTMVWYQHNFIGRFSLFWHFLHEISWPVNDWTSLVGRPQPYLRPEISSYYMKPLLWWAESSNVYLLRPHTPLRVTSV